MDRTTYIGSSDARAIMAGGYEWIELWKLKTRRVAPEDLSEKFIVQLGAFTEDFHLDWSIRKLIEEDGAWSEKADMRQGEFSRGGLSMPVVSHIDAMLEHEDGATCPVEAKHTHAEWSTGDALDFYMPQVQHHMLTTGAETALFSVIHGNAEPQRLFVGRSEAYLEIYKDAIREFVGYVERDEMPPISKPESAEKLTQDVTDKIPVNGLIAKDMTGDNQFASLAAAYLETKKAHGAHETAKKSIKKLVLPEHSRIYGHGLELKRDARGAIRFSEIKMAA